MTDPADLTIDDASEAIRTRVLSPVELTEACLARAERWEPILRAFVRLDPEQAVEQARALTEELARGDVRGPLHGIPVGIKDIIDVKGWPTTASSRVLTELPARRDAAVVDRLRAGGAVFGGKTNTHEFGYGVVTPPTRNPWDPACIPGGSSGGSAAAVAVGGCLGALGTDTAGSVRIPAALCGVSGLKPSRGAGPMSGIIPLAPSMDVCGPIARAARDVALLWQVMAGVPAPGPRGLDRVAVGVADPLSELAEVQPEVASALEAAVETLTEAGARRVPVDLPSVKEWNRPRMTVLMAEALEVHRGRGWYPARANAYTEETRSYLERAERTSPEEVTEACHALALLSRRLVAALDSVDVLALATTPIVAPRLEEAVRTSGASARRPVVGTLTGICGPVNWCGLASVTVPCGSGQGDLPIGVQFVAREEEGALGVALAFQSLTPFHTRAPRLPDPERPEATGGEG